MAGIFFDTFFNIEKYLEREQREQVALLQDPDGNTPELSDWERFAAEEYDFLVAEEVEEAEWDDGSVDLSPVKPSALLSPLDNLSLFSDCDLQLL